ncbi:MAG TPA: hypothetical protein EYP68_04060 [Candidatus Korarchaeota archaeon]|nr:hypothetical protein [Candidatus Korarchaeota archaeon]
MIRCGELLFSLDLLDGYDDKFGGYEPWEGGSLIGLWTVMLSFLSLFLIFVQQTILGLRRRILRLDLSI